MLAISPVPGAKSKKSIALTDAGKDFTRKTVDALREAELESLWALDPEERKAFVLLNWKYNEALAKNLEEALSDYGGTMLMVSHDRYFINKLADRVLCLTPDGLVEYSGGYDDFRAARKPSAQKSTSKDKKKLGSLSKEERKQAQSQRRKVLNRNKKVEELIESTERDIEELQKEYEAPEISSDYVKLHEISRRLDLLRRDLNAYFDEWESLQKEADLLK